MRIVNKTFTGFPGVHQLSAVKTVKIHSVLPLTD